MQRNETLKRTYNCNPYEIDCLRDELEHLAQKGWILETIKERHFIFKRGIPRKVRYFVQTNLFEEKQEIHAEDFQCENGLTIDESGWSLIGYNEKLIVFQSRSMNPSNIIEKQKESLEYIKKSDHSNKVITFLLTIIPTILSLYQIIGFSPFAFSSNLFLGIILILIITLLIQLSNFIAYRVWYVGAKRRILMEDYFRYRSVASFRLQNAVHYGVIAFFVGLLLTEGWLHIFSEGNALLIFHVIVIALILAVAISIGRYFLSKIVFIKNGLYQGTQYLPLLGIGVCLLVLYAYGQGWCSPEKEKEVYVIPYSYTDHMVTVYQDEIPVTLDDLNATDILGEEGYRNKEATVESSLLATHSKYIDEMIDRQNGVRKGISYEIYSSEYKWILEKNVQTMYLQKDSWTYFDIVSVNDSRWRAENVFALKIDDAYWYLVVYNNASLFIESEFELDDSQIELFVGLMDEITEHRLAEETDEDAGIGSEDDGEIPDGFDLGEDGQVQDGYDLDEGDMEQDIYDTEEPDGEEEYDSQEEPDEGIEDGTDDGTEDGSEDSEFDDENLDDQDALEL